MQVEILTETCALFVNAPEECESPEKDVIIKVYVYIAKPIHYRDPVADITLSVCILKRFGFRNIL